MKRVAVIMIDGKEVELESLTKEQKEKLADELNRRALAALGYRQIKTGF